MPKYHRNRGSSPVPTVGDGPASWGLATDTGGCGGTEFNFCPTTCWVVGRQPVAVLRELSSSFSEACAGGWLAM